MSDDALIAALSELVVRCYRADRKPEAGILLAMIAAVKTDSVDYLLAATETYTEAYTELLEMARAYERN